jgi:hypothetical protein
MSENFNAFEISPITQRGQDAVAPEIFTGIYAMPMFVRIPTSDLRASTEFWVRGLGFIELFSIPGRVVHLRRWAFQDVLLVPAIEMPAGPAAMTVSFAAVMSQIDSVAAACQELLAGSVNGPFDTPWNTLDLQVVTPERTRVVLTAAKSNDPDAEVVRNLEAVGLVAPQNGDHVSA